ncbi:hypothetical protein HYU19_02675 [Candidatus Woesearchaeota archaeon]|nr:hypothetical protein [Candidatus Woesearchaeota archaeon]
MGKFKKLFTSVRMILLIVFLLLAVIAIHPSLDREGVAVRSVVKNSAAALAGIESPLPTTSPMGRELILSVNNKPIKTVEDYYAATEGLGSNITVQVKTTAGVYRLTTKDKTEIITLNETELKEVNETVLVNTTVNGTIVQSNETVTKLVEVPKTETHVLGTEGLGLKVYPAPQNNLRKGLDLEGGTRVLLEPEDALSDADMEILLSNMQERLNVFGLSDVVVRKTKDLTGKQFILVEIAGANEDEVKDLLSRQGKFEAKIANETAFQGGKDLTFVCRTADCSGIDPQAGCSPAPDGWACRFRFSISLTPEAAAKHAAMTEKLAVVAGSGGADTAYLDQQLDLYLDDQLVDSLNIGADLQGRVVTDISITGSGSGASQELAMQGALDSMKRLQTILITGSLPVKLSIAKSDTISPALGESFVKNAIFIGLLVIAAVALVIIIAYRKLIISIPIIITLLSEVILMLGLASLIRWNLDLAAIAGIIIAAGTGVDDQIVVIDELQRGAKADDINWAKRIKQAFFIILAAYFATVVAMIPLLFAGAGMLKGFAFTTIAGISFGVFITRPAFAVMMETLLKKE